MVRGERERNFPLDGGVYFGWFGFVEILLFDMVIQEKGWGLFLWV